MHSRHTLELSNASSSGLEMKYCPIETVLTNPASSHTVASLAVSRRFVIRSSRLCAVIPRAEVSHVSMFGDDDDDSASKSVCRPASKWISHTNKGSHTETIYKSVSEMEPGSADSAFNFLLI